VTRESVVAYVGLGANLGDAARAVREAAESIHRLDGTRVTGRSSLYRTAPHEAAGPDFINAVVRISTQMAAPDLLAALQQLESAAGRKRSYVNAPRTLDLDLLMYGDARISSASLTVPHPRMGERAFVLVPLAEIAPDLVSPGQLMAASGQALSVFQAF
jgi:2-amino-4-hydroxy-6-hydroxymethyldihydropteridine diphosphokinase